MKPTTRVKQLEGSRLGGYGVVFGDAQNTDLQGDYFNSSTDFWLDKYKNQPLVFDHAMNRLPASMPADMPRKFVFGHIASVKMDDVGLWIEAVVDEHNDWVEAVLELIRKGVLHWSSGSVPHLADRRADGWLRSWPVVEWSTTPTPAEPRNTEVVLLKHWVDNGDPEAEPEEGPRGADTKHGLKSKSKEENVRMTLQLSEQAAAAMIKAYARQEWDSIADALNAIKQDGEEAPSGNMIEEALRPLAEELATMAGTTPDKALAVLVAFVAEQVAVEEEPAEEMPVEETMGTEIPTSLSIDRDELQQMLADAASKAVADALPQDERGASRTKKTVNINLNREEDRPLGLGTYIRWVAQKRYDLLDGRHKRIKAAYKALGIDPDTAGGYLVPVEQSNQVIELLRDTAKVYPLCRIVPMNSATMSIPEQTGGATGYWVGENAAITASQETFGQKLLVAKKLGVLVKLSNELLADSDPSIDALIREDIARVAALKIDTAILTGAGAAGEPRGVLNSGITATALNAAPTYANLTGAVSRVEVENVMETPEWTWVFNPREKSTLRQIEDTAGNLIFAGAGDYQQSMAGPAPGSLLGYPFVTTTQITVDTDNNNETRMFFGQWNDVIVGQRKTLEIVASNEAGDAFAYDQTWIRAILRLDVIVRHAESIEVLTDVRTS